MKAPQLLLAFGISLLAQVGQAQGNHTVPPPRGAEFTIEPASASRSGLVRLRGSRFSSVAEVRIGGLRAAIAQKQDNLIECFVPEGVALGPASVQLWGSPSPKRVVRYASMTVVAKEVLGGRFRWRVKLPDQYISTRPALGPDGTVYAIGNFGHVYAVSPSGALKWVASPSGGVGGVVDVLPNGNVVVGGGGGGGVQALSSVDGSQLWSFSLNTPLVAGPSVGPDGNIYAVDDSRWSQDVIGAFILSPTGQLLWSGGKYYRRGGGWTPQEIKFGGGNAYFWSDYSSTCDTAVLGGMNAIGIGGGLRWRVEDGVGILPDSGPNGGVSLFRPSTIEGRNANGGLLWSQPLGNFGQPQDEAVVASDGRTYFRTSNSRLHSISPTGQVIFTKILGGVVSNHVVRPDASQIALQFQPNFGVPALIQGYDRSANLLWSEQLPVENGTTIVCYNHMAYDPTGTTLFFGTVGAYTAQYEAHCYLYALNSQ
ncbi:MAG: PQQ-binding-like beta-propeller repeat protein [Fimbriimonadaceae bacterium]|nr:PQQ-binding-like beta-propeller repeat protein [Fimbriimonadaceae bacterium]